MNYRQRFAILNDKKKIIKTMCPQITNKSGIYMFSRINEDCNICIYVGQAKDLLSRTAQHLMDKKQHIDKSIYVHKLYDQISNPSGWFVRILEFCDEEMLDIREQHYIEYFRSKNDVVLYNVTGGGQFNKAEDIGERYEVKLKSYRNGKAIAYDKAKQYVKTMFDKYLDYTIKGKPTKIKERKLKEFKDFLGGTDNEFKEDRASS